MACIPPSPPPTPLPPFRWLIIRKKFTTSCEFNLFQVKLWYHIFSSTKMEEYMESVLSDVLRVKLVIKNIVLGFPGDPTSICFCSVMSFSKETYKCSEPDWHTLMFSFFKSILVWFMLKKRHFVYLIDHLYFWVPGDPFHAVTLRKHFMHMKIKSF